MVLNIIDFFLNRFWQRDISLLAFVRIRVLVSYFLSVMSVNQMNEYKNLRLEIMDHEKMQQSIQIHEQKTKVQENLEIGFTEVSS